VKDWNDLRHFLAIWRARTFAGAARELRVDQTTVGRRLTALEDAMGAPLFERTPDGLVPTALAAQLVEPALAVEQAMIDLERIVASGGERLEGAVRLATTEAFAICFVLPELRVLHAEHPDIALHLVAGGRSAADVGPYVVGGSAPDDPMSVPPIEALDQHGSALAIDARQRTAEVVISSRFPDERCRRPVHVRMDPTVPPTPHRHDAFNSRAQAFSSTARASSPSNRAARFSAGAIVRSSRYASTSRGST